MIRTRSKRIRLAHLTLGLDIGGQEKLLVEFARHADFERFDLHFLVLGARGRLAAAIEELGCPVTALFSQEGLRPGLVWRLARWFRQNRIDVVHTHDDKPILYGSPAARLAGVKRLIHTQHHGVLPQISRRQAWAVQWAGRLADAFVCVSQDGARNMAETGFPPERLDVLWNGIDLAKFPYHGQTSGGPAVTVARLSPEKDIANLLRAAALVVKSCPDFRLEVAGDGPCRNELVELASSLGLANHVRFLGEMSNVPALLAGASLFILPSRTEGISLTLLEAMASGLPVVATRVGGNPEVVREGTTGLLVPACDPLALSGAILQLWRDPSVSRRMGEAGRRTVEADFDIKRMVACYEELYRFRAPAHGASPNCELGLKKEPTSGVERIFAVSSK